MRELNDADCASPTAATGGDAIQQSEIVSSGNRECWYTVATENADTFNVHIAAVNGVNDIDHIDTLLRPCARLCLRRRLISRFFGDSQKKGELVRTGFVQKNFFSDIRRMKKKSANR